MIIPRRGTLLAVLALMAGCGDWVPTTANDAQTIDSSPGTLDARPTIDAAMCGADSFCLPEAPANWNGPVMVYEGASDTPAPTCPALWPTLAQNVRSDLTAPGDCGCECGPATGMTCAASAKVFDQGSNSTTGCATVGALFATLNPNQCASVGVSSTSFYTVDNPNTTGGTCASSVLDTLAPPTFAQNVRSCGNDTLTGGGCSAGAVCAPSGDAQFDRVCIFSVGDNQCPVGSPYTEREVFYDGFTDDRSCGACSCGAVAGKCNPNIDFTSSCTSTSTLDARLSAGQCKKLNANSAGATYFPQPAGTCGPSPATVNGAASPTGPSTYCCIP